MRYPCLIALAIFMAMPTVSTQADEPTADQRLRPGPSPPRTAKPRVCKTTQPSVFSESGLARFRLVSGRIDVDPMRYRKGTQEIDVDGFHETITVSSSRGVPSVYYSFRDDYQRIQLVAEHGKSLRIESTLISTGEQAVLEQFDQTEITWTTKRDPGMDSPLDTQISGPTLLHIVGQDEPGFQIHIGAMITRMLRGRCLIDLTHQTESYLQQNYGNLSTISTREVHELIDQLRSPKCIKRRSAAKRLAGLGTSIVPHLNAALKRIDLDAEQKTRIQSLIARCPRMDEDTASSLACLLSTDRDHWQIMARKMSKDQWIAANDHVLRCGLAALVR